MANKIIVEIDLDELEAQRKLENLEKKSKETGDQIKSNLSDPLGKDLVNSTGKTKKSVDSLGNSFDKTFSILATAIPTVIFLEERFGLFSKIAENVLGKFGISLDMVKEAILGIAEAFDNLLTGKGSFDDLKMAVFFLLKELNLLPAVLVKVLEFSKTFTNLPKTIVALVQVIASVLPEIAAGFAFIGSSATLAFGILTTKGEETLRVIRGLTSVIFKPTGLFGVTALLGDLAIGFFALSQAADVFDNTIARAVSKASFFASVVLGGMSAALTVIITKVAELGRGLSSDLIGFFKEQTKVFNEGERSVLVFSASVDAMNRATNGAIGGFESLNEIVGTVADTFNVSTTAVTKSAQELVLVGTRLGLTREQIEKLIVASVELAKINRKDVFQTTVKVVNALNGNAQALAALGIKLNEASVATFAYNKGLKGKFRSLSDNEKVQFRYNKLLSQYSDIAGVGIVAASSLADQSERLAINIKGVNEALGAGARLIEDNNIVATLYNKILSNVSDSVFKVAGFLGALGSRILQVGSIVLGLSFQFFFLIKSIKALDFLFKQDSFIGLLEKKIPIISRSFDELTSSLLGVNFKLRKTSDILSFLGILIKNTINTALVTLTGTTFAASGAMGVLRGAIGNVVFVLKKMLMFLAPILIPLIKIAVVVAIIVGAFKLFKSALEAIEQRTKVFSETYRIVLDALSSSVSILEPVITLFNNFKTVLVRLAQQGFGLIITAISKVLSVMAAIVAKNPFGVFSDSTVASFSAMEDSLDSFGDKLIANNFILDAYGDGAKRMVAGVSEGVMAATEETGNFLQHIGRLYEGISIKFKSTAEQIKQQSKGIADAVKGTFVKSISGGIQNIVSSLAKGEDVFGNFANFILNTFGDLAIQMGQVLIATGIGVQSLFNLQGAQAVAAGAGLVAIGAVMKAFAGGSSSSASSTNNSGGGGGGGGTFGSGGGQNFLAEPDNFEDRQTTSTITINVEGSLVQQEELGLFIQDTLNEVNEKNGIIQVNARTA